MARRRPAFAPGGRALLYPAAFALGSALYFALPHEPAVWAAPGAGLGLFAFAWRVRVRRAGLAAALVLSAAAAAGFAAADLRTAAAAAPVVIDDGRARAVTGWVERVDAAGGSRRRYLMRVETIEGPARPVKVRVSAGGGAGLGDRIALRAVLQPPPGPATPGAYDFSRAAWFDRIGGVGYAVSKVEVLEGGPMPLARRLARLRGDLSRRLAAAGDAETGPVVAALVTGDRGDIAADVTEALRAAGLGHILAISGLHMALVGGGAFAVFALGFASIAPLARRMNTRKLAAGAALLAATAYLLVSGGSISTQRAYVMAAVAFAAILLDRRALSLRNVATAAAIVLVLAPESALTPGFQMSFAATAALIAVYEIGRRRRRAQEVLPALKGPLDGALKFARNLAITSLVAGAATAPFAAYHFNRIAVFGAFANLAAMPAFSLVAMPAAASAGALAPLGLEKPPAIVAGWGMRWVIGVARNAQAREGALAPAPAAPPIALALAVAALLAGCVLIRGRLVVAGPLAACAALAWGQGPRPDLFVGEEGRTLLVDRQSGGVELVAAPGSGRGYAAELFARRVGADMDERPVKLADRFACDARGCVGGLAGRRIAVAFDLSALGDDCARADLVVAPRVPPARIVARCEGVAMVWPEPGGALVTLTPGGPEVTRGAERRRPWNAGPAGEPEDQS